MDLEAVSVRFSSKIKMGWKVQFTFFYEGRKKQEEVPLGDLQDNVVDLVHYLREKFAHICLY